ncbi:MAG: VOC family protein [Bacteroidetes bacterium]|nr:VOC family protein [Bacteroidota bacterium]
MSWNHSINWFEIPALNLERAFNFYNIVLGGHVRKGTFGNGDLVLFDVPFSTGEAVGGAIVVRPDLKPTTEGPVIYINTFDNIDECINRVSVAGGKVIVDKIDLGKFGYSAIIIDSEGNKIGLHQNTK